jgi:ribosomal protein L31E
MIAAARTAVALLALANPAIARMKTAIAKRVCAIARTKSATATMRNAIARKVLAIAKIRIAPAISSHVLAKRRNTPPRAMRSRRLAPAIVRPLPNRNLLMKKTTNHYGNPI